MDKETLLPTCLHGGPIDAENLKKFQANSSSTKYLLESIENYGSTAVLAFDGDKIVGLLRFYPEEIYALMTENVCIHQKQVEESFNEIVESSELPRRAELSGRLKVQCIQIATGYHTGNSDEDYGNKGIGRQMYEKLIEWAKANNWTDLSTPAVNKIPPLIQWTGYYPKTSLIDLGFEVKTIKPSESLEEGIFNQQQGFHGTDVKENWKNYMDVDRKEAAKIYEMNIKL